MERDASIRVIEESSGFCAAPRVRFRQCGTGGPACSSSRLTCCICRMFSSSAAFSRAQGLA
jgi:hypothetical protein